MELSKEKREENESDLCMNSKWQKPMLKKQGGGGEGREMGSSNKSDPSRGQPFVPTKSSE